MKDFSNVDIRPANKNDANSLAKFINIAGEGIPEYFWQMSATEEKSAIDIGIERASRDIGGFSYKNAHVAVLNNQVVGMILIYPLEQPSQADINELENLPAVIRPMVELEYMVANTYYINALAVSEHVRNEGIGSKLISCAELEAKKSGFKTMSIQVFSQNQKALNLYIRQGYSEIQRLPVLEHPCPPFYDEDIVLLTKTLNL